MEHGNDVRRDAVAARVWRDRRAYGATGARMARPARLRLDTATRVRTPGRQSEMDSCPIFPPLGPPHDSPQRGDEAPRLVRRSVLVQTCNGSVGAPLSPGRGALINAPLPGDKGMIAADARTGRARHRTLIGHDIPMPASAYRACCAMHLLRASGVAHDADGGRIGRHPTHHTLLTCATQGLHMRVR